MPIPAFSPDALERGKSFPGDCRGTPRVAPTLLTGALAHKGDLQPKLLLSQGLKAAALRRVLHWPGLVLVGAAVFLLRAEAVKPQGSSKPGRGSSCGWGTGRGGCSKRGFLRKRGLSNPAKTGRAAGRGHKEHQLGGDSQGQGQRGAGWHKVAVNS